MSEKTGTRNRREKPKPPCRTLGKRIVNISISELHPFPNHSFKVKDDDTMQGT